MLLLFLNQEQPFRYTKARANLLQWKTKYSFFLIYRLINTILLILLIR